MKSIVGQIIVIVTLWIVTVAPLYSNEEENSTQVLKSASLEQRNDKLFVLKAVAYAGSNLEYASEELKEDKDVVLKAIESSYLNVFKFAGKKLQNDKAFIKEAIEVNEYVITELNNTLQEDRELLFFALERNVAVFKYLSHLKQDKKLIIESIERDLDILPYIDEYLKDDKEIMEAIKNLPHKWAYLENSLLLIIYILLTFFLYFALVKKEKKWRYIWAILAFVGLLKIIEFYFVHGVFRQPYQLVDEQHKFGLEPIHCWFGGEENLSNVECYNMHVPEIYNDSTSRVITFPVRIFRSSEMFTTKAPVLHLGGGGPGADMGLDSAYAMQNILKDHNGFSLNQGRDLFVIDPRGAGLSKPLLNCPDFSANVLNRVIKGLTLEDEISASEEDYAKCIEDLKDKQVDFNGYNSITIANDVERLREAVGVDKWVLFGVSYSTIYSMFVAKKYPNSVDTMILDSSCFPNLKQDHNYLLQVMDRFNALYNYKDKITDLNLTNEQRDMNISMKLWSLHEKLNNEPIMVNSLDIKVNGDYFIESLLWGVYGTTIFNDLPKIISEVENNSSKTFSSYFDNYLYWLMDSSYGDVASMAHYCYEDKPFIDREFMREQNRKLPKGYIQEATTLFFDMNDFCKEMNISSMDRSLNEPIHTAVPTLFIHGEFDSITPLRDVKEQMKGFTNAKILTYKKAHAVLSDGKIEDDIAQFLSD